jgi:hypothetical protein
MKKYVNIIGLALIILLVILLTSKVNCNPKIIKQKITITSSDTVTLYDTLKVEIPKYIPKWTERTIHDTLLINVDTAAILEDYYCMYGYSDTINRDSLKLIINDIVTQNKIMSRNIKYDIVRTTKVINNNIIVKKRGTYVGLGTIIDGGQIKYISPEIILRTKEDLIFGLGAGGLRINNTGKPIVSLRFLYPIKK